MPQKITKPYTWWDLTHKTNRDSFTHHPYPGSPYLGITLPTTNGSNGYFSATKSAMVQIQTNLINLILTKKGERIMHPDFGCDIHSLVFEQITDDLQAAAKGTIVSAAQSWMPFIVINDVTMTKDEDTNKIHLTVSFSLRSSPSYAPGVFEDTSSVKLVI